MTSKHRKTLETIFTGPVNGAMEWARIDALLREWSARLSRVRVRPSSLRKTASAPTFTPPPDKEALRHRVRAVRDYLQTLGIKP